MNELSPLTDSQQVSLITSNEAFLTSIAEDSNGIGNINAQLLLEFAGVRDYPEEIRLPYIINGTKSLKLNTAQSDTIVKKIKVFPNPLSDELYIEIPLSDVNRYSNFEIYDLPGNKIKVITVLKNTTFIRVDTSTIPSGTYILKSGDGCFSSLFSVIK
jgi:hypothetical protein